MEMPNEANRWTIHTPDSDMRSVRHRLEFGDRAIEVEVMGYDAEDAVHIIDCLTGEDDPEPTEATP